MEEILREKAGTLCQEVWNQASETDHANFLAANSAMQITAMSVAVCPASGTDVKVISSTHIAASHVFVS
jgi:hypothetical protein